MRCYAEHAEAFLADEPLANPSSVRRRRRTPATSRSGRCSRSCRGTSRSGRSSASPPRADGGQRRPAQARVERAADARSTSRTCSPRRVPRGRVPDAAHRGRATSRRSCATRGSRPRRSPAASRPAGRSARSPATRSSTPCSSSAAATRSSSCRPPTSTGPPRSRSPHGCQNNGQSCIAAKRFIVHDGRLRRLRRASSSRRMAALVVGDPMDEETEVGPLATESGVTDLEELVADATRKGAQRAVRRAALGPAGLVLPADRARRHHARHARVRSRSSSARWPAVPVRSHRRGHRHRQRHDFGLGSNAWTNDADEQERFVNELEAGRSSSTA